MRWELIVDKLETAMCVGIYEHEQSPQKLIVSARIWANYPAKPQSIDECIDYDIICDLVTNQWPKRPQVELLETLVIELFEFIFASSEKIDEAEVSIFKPDAHKNIDRLGLRATLTRREFEKL